MVNSDILKVLLFSSSSGSKGGGELYLVGLAQGLHNLGHEVSSWLATHSRMDRLAELLEPWSTVRRIPYCNTYDRPLRSAGALLARRQISRLAREFRRANPDVIHVNQQCLEDGLDLILAASASKSPFVSTVHITRTPSRLGAFAGNLRDSLARATLKQTKGGLVAISRSGERELAEFLSEPGAPRVQLVPNGVPPAPSADRGRIRSEWGFSERDFVIGCVARLEAQKNPQFLIELLTHLPERVKLAWIGDGQLRESFVQTADSLHVRGRVHVDGWREDARERMAGLDLFVLPSQYEGCPLALLEAMSTGLACCASDVDGVSDAIIDGETGCLLPFGKLDAWAFCVARLLEDPEERARLGAAARRRFFQEFTVEAMARRTSDAYRAAISRTTHALVAAK